MTIATTTEAQTEQIRALMVAHWARGGDRGVVATCERALNGCERSAAVCLGYIETRGMKVSRPWKN
jgi:hypothetical protein